MLPVLCLSSYCFWSLVAVALVASQFGVLGSGKLQQGTLRDYYALKRHCLKEWPESMHDEVEAFQDFSGKCALKGLEGSASGGGLGVGVSSFLGFWCHASDASSSAARFTLLHTVSW